MEIKKLKRNNNFISMASDGISLNLLNYAEKYRKQEEYTFKFNCILLDFDVSTKIENSIFEFSLVNVTMNNYSNMFFSPIYNCKANSLLNYLRKNNYKNNLMESLISKSIKPEFVAFMSPEQLDPQSWEHITNKKRINEEIQNNMAVSDLYKCRRCGESKCRISQMQTRSCDEPITTFVVCLNCKKVFTV